MSHHNQSKKGTEMTNDMLTRLSISVSGKADGKEVIADMIVTAIQSVHGTLVQRKGDNNGVHLKVELTADAMKALSDGAFPPPLRSFMGDDVEIRGGKIRAKVEIIDGGETLLQPGEPLLLSCGQVDRIRDLMKARSLAINFLALGGADQEQAITGRLPAYACGSDVLESVVTSAREAVERADLELAAMGVRLIEGKA